VQLVSASSPSHQVLGSKPSLCRISAGVRLCFGYSLPQTPLVWEPLALGLPFFSPIVTNWIHGLVLVACLINTWSVILKSTHGLVLVAWLISNIFPILTEFSAGLFLRCCFDAEFWKSMDAELLPRHCGKKLGVGANPNRSPFVWSWELLPSA
jgi:hypothetical protein